MNTQILLMGNGSPENGGCEAITKGTLEILKQSMPQMSVLDSFFDYTGRFKTAEGVYPVAYPARWTAKWWILQPALHYSSAWTSYLLYRSHEKEIKNSAAVLSLGGDNYSLDYGVPRRFIAMGQYVRKHHIPFVIWGASIGPFERGSSFEKQMAHHLKHEVDLILVREEETKRYLQSIGVADNVRVLADPAFMMQPEPCSEKLPAAYVCINFSDLMAKYVTRGNMEQWLDYCAQMIDLLAEVTTLPLVFVPHVKADYSFAQRILPKAKHADRVVLLSDKLNAAQMKGVIAKAECNIACRTHSTIASFSSSVPTLSLGYSIKSKGLNLQMYGHEDFLIYKEEITPQKVKEVFVQMCAQNEAIRKQLAEKNIVVKQQSLDAGRCLKELIEKYRR